jgi:type II secretion system protein G
MQRAHSAFSLIELMVVIAIIAILAGFGAASLVSSSRRARDAVRKSDLAQIQQALVMYKANYGIFPTGAGGIATLVNTELNAAQFKTYLADLPQPPLSGSESDYYYKCHSLGYGNQCTKFSLCTGGLPNGTGLEFVGNGLGNAVNKEGAECPTTGGSTCRYYCVFGP